MSLTGSRRRIYSTTIRVSRNQKNPPQKTMSSNKGLLLLDPKNPDLSVLSPDSRYVLNSGFEIPLLGFGVSGLG
jgi:hypothetical protein